MRPLAFLIVLSLGCTTKATVGDAPTEPPAADPADERSEADPSGWTVAEEEVDASEDDLRSRIPAGAIVHTEPISDQDETVMQMLAEHRYFLLPVLRGNLLEPQIEDPDFFALWDPFDTSETHYQVLDPVPGTAEAHAFRCGDQRWYLVTDDLYYSCSANRLYYRTGVANELLNDELNEWFQRLRSLDVGTITDPFVFIAVTPGRVLTTRRAFEIVDLNGIFPTLVEHHPGEPDQSRTVSP